MQHPSAAGAPPLRCGIPSVPALPAVLPRTPVEQASKVMADKQEAAQRTISVALQVRARGGGMLPPAVVCSVWGVESRVEGEMFFLLVRSPACTAVARQAQGLAITLRSMVGMCVRHACRARRRASEQMLRCRAARSAVRRARPTTPARCWMRQAHLRWWVGVDATAAGRGSRQAALCLVLAVHDALMSVDARSALQDEAGTPQQ